MQYFTAYFGDINKNVAGIFSAAPNLQNIRFLYGHLSSPWCIMYEDVHFRQKEKREGFYEKEMACWHICIIDKYHMYIRLWSFL